MVKLFNSPPSGNQEFLDFQDVVDRIIKLEEKITKLSEQIEEIKKSK